MIKLEDIKCAPENVIASDGKGKKLIAVSHIIETPFISFYIEEGCEVVYETRDFIDAISKFNS